MSESTYTHDSSQPLKAVQCDTRLILKPCLTYKVCWQTQGCSALLCMPNNNETWARCCFAASYLGWRLRCFIKLFPLDIGQLKFEPCGCTDWRHTLSPSGSVLRDKILHTHTHITFTPDCVFPLVRLSNRGSYCTEPSQWKNISLLGKAQPSLYGDASSVVRAHLLASFSHSFTSRFLWEFFISDLLAGERAGPPFIRVWLDVWSPIKKKN